MAVIAPGASFTISFITKEGVSTLDACTLVNKNTNVSTSLVKGTTIDYWDADYYTQATVTHTVAEGEFYEYTVYNDQSEIVAMGRVFCTSQTDYSIHDGEYTENSTTNEYITR